MMKVKLYELMKNNGIIIDEDVFFYGYKILVNYSLFLIISVLIAFLTNTMFQYTLFILLFIPLRKYSGGFHFSKTKHCFIGSILLTTVISQFAAHPYNLNIFTFILISFIFTCVNYKIGVVDNINKQLNVIEKKAHLKIEMKLSVLYIFIMVLTYTVAYNVTYIIFTVILLNSISVTAGYIVNKHAIMV